MYSLLVYLHNSKCFFYLIVLEAESVSGFVSAYTAWFLSFPCMLIGSVSSSLRQPVMLPLNPKKTLSLMPQRTHKFYCDFL